MLSKRKTTSLFEVLPATSASQESKPSGSYKERIVEKVKEYKKVDDTPVSAVKDRPSTRATEAKREAIPDEPKSPQRVSRSSFDRTEAPIGTSSNGQFYIVICVFACFSIATGLFGYKLGKDKGFEKGAEYGVNLRSKKQNTIYPREYIGKETNKKANHIKSVGMSGTSITNLPVIVDKLSEEQKKVIAPPAQINRYTIQIQTFGRNQSKSAKELVEYLSNSGIDAFGDYKNGVVYAGRFQKRNSASKALQKRIARFNWKGINFKDSFFNRIPTSLLKEQ
jgi:hypothetical protein